MHCHLKKFSICNNHNRFPFFLAFSKLRVKRNLSNSRSFN
uniref:Uncharacterized protein n=1 Tax=Rhizophora mucronata TaxID=61149 RepID=A0A2P2PET7_RHIMU